MSATVADWPEPDQVPTMLQHISDDRLERALRESPLPEGEWCVRRLDLAVALDPDRPLSALETDWADQIVTALRVSLRDGSQDVVRYLRPEQAVDDLLLGLSTGRYEHTWAWRQVGLLEVNDPEPHLDRCRVFLLVLARLGHGRIAALSRLVRSAGAASVHRLLGNAGWIRVATLVAAEAGVVWAPTEAPAPDPVAVPTEVPTPDPAALPKATGSPASTTETGRVAALARAISTSSSLAPALRGSGLRVDADTLQAWAVLAIGDTDPRLLRAAPRPLHRLIMAVGERLLPPVAPGLGAAGGHRSSTGQIRPATAAPVPMKPDGPSAAGGDSGVQAARTDTAANPVAPGTATTADLDRSEPTVHPLPIPTSSWGGLLFLLNSAADAGLPGLLDEPPLDAHPTPWVLHRLGRALVPIGPDDPALMAFSGLTSGWPEQPLKKAERRAVAACARSWIAATARRLRPGGAKDGEPTDAELVHRLARRAATIEREPGWVEVRLRLDEVDLDVRRGGLDLDPGWVWWLGHVVRFRYE